MQADTRRLTTWVEALANHIEGSGTRLVVTDACQGYSPAHDLVHLMTRTAVAEAEQKLGRSVTLVEHAPVPEDEWPRQARTAPFETCKLDESTAAAKLETAQSHEDLRQEIEAIGATRSPHMLAVERLYYVDRQLDLQRLYTQTPYFDRIGRERVKAGIYTSALTAEHMRRVARLLCANLEETVRAV